MRSRWLRYAAVFVLGFGLYSLVWPRISEAMFWAGEPTVDAIVTHFMEHQDIRGGASVAIGRAGSEPTLYAFGMADTARQTPMRTDHHLGIASVSKIVTSSAALLLIDQGKMSLDDKLVDLIPDVAKAKDKRYREITVRNLLHHTSGIGWPEAMSSYLQTSEPTIIVDCGEALQKLLSLPLEAAPGTAPIYGDYNACWLGKIIERVTGKRYEDFVTGELLSPLGIHEMKVSLYDTDVVQFDKGNTPRRRQFAEASAWTTTAADLFKLMSRQIRPIETERDPNDTENPYYFGLGWWVWPTDDGPDIAHTGLTNGVSALAIRTHDGIIAVALFNSDQKTRNRESLWQMQRELAAAYRRMTINPQ